MRFVEYVILGIVLFGLLSGCYGDYVGNSLNESGHPCETYELKNGTQATYCDQRNRHSPFPRH